MVFVFVASVLGEVFGNSPAKLVIRLSDGRGGWESCDYNRQSLKRGIGFKKPVYLFIWFR